MRQTFYVIETLALFQINRDIIFITLLIYLELKTPTDEKSSLPSVGFMKLPFCLTVTLYQLTFKVEYVLHLWMVLLF